MKKRTLFAIVIGLLSGMIAKLYDFSIHDAYWYIIVIFIVVVFNVFYHFCEDD